MKTIVVKRLKLVRPKPHSYEQLIFSVQISLQKHDCLTRTCKTIIKFVVLLFMERLRSDFLNIGEYIDYFRAIVDFSKKVIV